MAKKVLGSLKAILRDAKMQRSFAKASSRLTVQPKGLGVAPIYATISND
jgi:hypothetical protein